MSLILSAYFEKRMAWFPVDRLQMEVSAMTGANLYVRWDIHSMQAHA